MTRPTLVRLARGTLLVTLAVGLLWALGCAEDVQFLTSKNDVRIVSVPDTFKVDAKDLENVYDTIDTTWVITGPIAHVSHRSFVPHGQSEVTIRDATGTVVYHRELLFEIESVTVDPLVALVVGDADQLAELTEVDTDPIPMTGVSGNETVHIGLALPTGVIAVGDDQVTVTIAVRPVTATRTFNAGLRLVGAANNLQYALSTDRVLVTIGGSTADLDRLSATTLVVDLDVTGLTSGAHEVPVTANLPTGTALVAASPPEVTVTITPAPPPSPVSGAASPAPSGG